VAAVLTSSAIAAFHSRSLVALCAFDLLLWIVNGGNKFSVPDSTQDKLLPFLLLASNALRVTQAARRDGFSFHRESSGLSRRVWRSQAAIFYRLRSD
jgi:hypothetical protein